MKQQNYTSLAESKERKNFPGLPLLLLLLLLALVTSGIVGFILGNNSEPPFAWPDYRYHSAGTGFTFCRGNHTSYRKGILYRRNTGRLTQPGASQ